MRRAQTAPRLVQAEKAGIGIMQGAGLLNQTVSLFVQGLLLKARCNFEFHVRVQGKRVGRCGIPSKGGTKVLGSREGERTIDAEIRPGVRVELCGNGKGGEMGCEEFYSVVRGSRVTDADGVHDRKGRGNRATKDAGFVFDHEEEDETNVCGGHDLGG